MLSYATEMVRMRFLLTVLKRIMCQMRAIIIFWIVLQIYSNLIKTSPC